MDKKKLVEIIMKEAESEFLKEYNLRQRVKLSSFIKFLITAGVTPQEIKPITDFYSPSENFQHENFQAEDELLYNEFKRKLLDLANAKNINIPDEFK